MTDNTEPKRWLDSAEQAPAELRALLLAETQADSGSDTAQLARLLQRVASEVKRPELCHAQADSAPTALARRFGLLGKAAIGIAMLGIAALAWRFGQASEPRAVQPTVARVVATPAAAKLPSRSAALDTPPQAASAPTAAPAQVPAQASSKSRVSARPAQAAHIASDSVAELALLERAQRALHADPRHALELARQHELAFAQGEFVQEREMLAIEALQALGRDEDAQRRGRSFLRRFAQSSHAPRLQRLLGLPER